MTRLTAYVSIDGDDTHDRLHVCLQPCMKEVLKDMGISRRTRGRMTGVGFDGTAYRVTVRRRVENSDFCDLCGTGGGGVGEGTPDPIQAQVVDGMVRHAGSSGTVFQGVAAV